MGLLRDGATLTEVTRRGDDPPGLTARVLLDDRRRRHHHDRDLRRRPGLPYAENLVAEQAAPAVRGVAFEGIGLAVPGAGVLAAIESAHLIVSGPADPAAGLLPHPRGCPA